MAERIPEIPGFWLVAALSLATIGVEIAIVLLSWVRLARQKRAQVRATAGNWQAVAALKPPSRLPEIIAALMPLAVVVTSGLIIQGSRHLLVTALGKVDPDEKALLSYRALNELLNATAMGLWAVPPTLLFGGVAVALAISARLRARGLRRAESLAARADDASAWLKFPGPRSSALVGAIGAFLVLGFAPLARAGFAAIATTISHFAATAGLPPEERGAIISEGFDRFSRFLDQGFVVARVGVAVAALIAVYLAWRFSPARARAGVPGGARPVPSEGLFGLVIALGAIAAAVAGFLAARPMREENHLAWPPYEAEDWLTGRIATPDLEGPDKLDRAQVIHVTPDGLDQRDALALSSAMKLQTAGRNSRRRRPHQDGQVVVVCQSDTPIHRLDDALRAAANGGMPHAVFVFSGRQATDRPLFGQRWRKRARAARTTVVESEADAAPGAAIIAVGRFETCAALSREIVAARRAGREVALLLGPVASPDGAP